MMEKSSLFLSLSGASGITIGIAGCLAGIIAAAKIGSLLLTSDVVWQIKTSYSTALFLFILGVITLLIAFAAAIFFTYLRSKKKQLPLWTVSSRQFTAGFFIPLFTGGFLTLALIYHHFYLLIPGVLLIFYGLALLNASKYSHEELEYMGLINVLLGIVTAFFHQYGLIFWIIGFGVITAVYGIVVHIKYE